MQQIEDYPEVSKALSKQHRGPIHGMLMQSPQVQDFAKFIGALNLRISTLAIKVQPYIDAILAASEAARDVGQFIQTLPERSRAAMERASACGWYFGWHDSLSEVHKLISRLQDAEDAEIDKIMATHYRHNLAAFEEEIVSRFPARAKPIAAALMAHRDLGEAGYHLAIPVLIAQTDGILSEIVGLPSGMTKDNKGMGIKAAAAFRDMIEGDAMSMHLADPVFQMHNSLFLMSAEKRNLLSTQSGEAFMALNRHRVMHGEDSDYGSEVNSLKAFSLLVFVGCHLPSLLEHRDKAQQMTSPSGISSAS